MKKNKKPEQPFKGVTEDEWSCPIALTADQIEAHYEQSNPEIHSICVWHKDGEGNIAGSHYKSVKVYRNGELMKTDGNWDLVTVVLEY